MKQKIKYTFLALLSLYVGFTFYMSPSFFGLIPGGKDIPDNAIYKLEFDKVRTSDRIIKYKINTQDSSLTKLREEFKLNSIIRDTKDDFEKVLKIQSWVQSRWKHSADNTPEINDAYYILKQAEKGQRFRCVEYSRVASECLKSLGFKVRNLGLMTKDIDVVNNGGGHAVNEVYIKDLKKWIFIDPQFDVIVTENGIPLNAVELQNAIAEKRIIEIINPNNVITKEEYIQWIGKYLFYFTTSLNQGKVSIWDRVIGSKKLLTLVPKGEKEPKYMQRMFRLNNAYFTNSIIDFYPTE